VQPRRIGRYELEGELGRGGMAVVYRAVDPAIRRGAAVKVIRKADLDPAKAPAILERFKREAQAAASLRHPNIVAIYEYGEDDAFAWIAMELVEGRSLADHLQAGWRPEPVRLPAVLEELLEALDYSHSRGVVHRDVKPANILVSEMGQARITDFGIARIERADLTQAGEVRGTPYYMSPEQYDGHPADECADIYAAATVIYQALCGRRPFEGEGASLMRQVLEATPAPPSTYEPSLPVTVDMVLAKALARRPQNRYQSAREFLEALRNAFPATASLAPVSRPVPSAPETAPSAPGTAPGAPGTAPSGRRLPANVGALRRALGASAPVGAPAAPEPARARRPAVLFVDDEARVLNALEFLFRDTFEVTSAAGGAQALERLRERRFHVLVSDQRMPEMLGVELLREAKAIAPSTVRILLTGYSDLAAIVGSVNDGEVFRFVSKPWQEEELRATLAEAVDVAIALEAAAARPAASAQTQAGVLVLGEAALARGARELARGAYQVYEASAVETALGVLAEEEIAAVVCDLDAGAGEPAALLRVLKQRSPQTQLIAASAATDSETIISLINEARICRFLKKPVNLSLLQGAVGAARERYAQLVQMPGLVRAESAKRAPETDAARSILGRLRALGGRFAAALGVRP
jgi:serine/threonine-protein kinase